MRLPNLKDVFYELFCKPEYAPSDRKPNHFCDLLDAAAAKYQIPFHDHEELYTSFMDHILDERYSGFLLGFSWAILLLTGKHPNIDEDDSSE